MDRKERRGDMLNIPKFYFISQLDVKSIPPTYKNNLVHIWPNVMEDTILYEIVTDDSEHRTRFSILKNLKEEDLTHLKLLDIHLKITKNERIEELLDILITKGITKARLG